METTEDNAVEQSNVKVMTTKEVQVQLVPMLEVGEDNIPTRWIYFLKMKDTDGNKIACELQFLENYIKQVREEIDKVEKMYPLSKEPINIKGE